MHTDSAAVAIAKAETLISSKLYPKHAVAVTPTGYSIVSTNNKNIRIDIAFFHIITLLFPQHLFAYWFESVLDKSAKYNCQQYADSI